MNDRGCDNLSFWGHLEEVRRRLLWILLTWGAGSAVCFPLSRSVIEYISRPVGRLVFLSPSEAFVVRLKLSLFLGLMISLPVAVYHVLSFLWGALEDAERRVFLYCCGFVCVLSSLGWMFADKILAPLSFRFLLGFGGAAFQPMITAENYLSFYLGLTFFCCLLFNMPCLIMGLAFLGMISGQALSRYRRHVCAAAFIVSAVLTPPDAVTQVLMAAPIYLLYEISLLGVRIFVRKRPTADDKDIEIQ